MIADPKKLSVEFLRTHPGATKEHAIEYANRHFPHSPLSIAEFLMDWQSLRERLADAKRGSGELLYR
jgi:hypothetical protein